MIQNCKLIKLKSVFHFVVNVITCETGVKIYETPN